MFFRTRFISPDILCTSGIETSQHFQGPSGPLVLTFCGSSLNFEGNWLEGPPHFNPWVLHIVLHDGLYLLYT